MPIDRNLADQQSFTPDELALMKQAFEEVWTAHSSNVVSGHHQAARDVVAAAIVVAAGTANARWVLLWKPARRRWAARLPRVVGRPTLGHLGRAWECSSHPAPCLRRALLTPLRWPGVRRALAQLQPIAPV